MLDEETDMADSTASARLSWSKERLAGPRFCSGPSEARFLNWRLLIVRARLNMSPNAVSTIAQSHSQEHQQPQSLSPQDKGSHCQIRQYKNGFLLSAQQPAPTVLGCCAPHANQHASKNAQAASHLWALDERDWILDETEWALLGKSVQPPRAVSSSLRSSEAAKRESFDAPTAAICHRLTQYPIWLP